MSDRGSGPRIIEQMCALGCFSSGRIFYEGGGAYSPEKSLMEGGERSANT